ncbi:hypothetical protein FOCC_FOCC006298 [Frankliniella occidentalis]|nr:hypothetical protein FOCC_FOCC006298 [Frankliniella occidentalis]
MEIMLKENQKLKEKLAAAFKNISPPEATATEFSIVNLLLECAKENAGRKVGGWRYRDVMKELGFLIFSLGGVALYEILCHKKNFPFPSITTIRRKIYSNDKFVEGEYRIKQCKEFLLRNDCPLEIFLCEDATCITGRIQYDSTSNQVVGFTLPLNHNGIPKVKNFPATSANQIAEYFRTQSSSRYAYCIMAVPLKEGAPPFCLGFFGTDNKFKASHVQSRLVWTKEALEKEGITVVGYGSDGDTRLLSTMCVNVISSSPAQWKWFSAKKKVKQVFIQDHIHIGAKLKTRLLKPSIILPLGQNHVASRGHLVELIQTVSKDQHELYDAHINVKDKMNYRAVQMITAEKVTALLRSDISDSHGTALYLDMIREILNSFIQVSLKPLERITMLWKWVFFLRMWRAWISGSSDYTVKNNFISSNSYACIEINAHCLIQLIISLRDSEKHSLFMPWKLSSQECEKTFRILRSAVASHCGVVSFSILDLGNYFCRLDILASTYLKLENVIEIPRRRKAFQSTANEAPHIPNCLPEDYEIEAAVHDALQQAIGLGKKFNLIPKSYTGIPRSYLRERADLAADIDKLNDDSEIDLDIFDLEDEEDGNNTEVEVGAGDEYNDVAEDLFMVSTGSLGVKKYNNVILTENSPFVLVADGFKTPAIIRKTTLCWLLASGNTKLSPDRLVRVMAKPVNHQLALTSRRKIVNPSTEDHIIIGDWCAFLSETNDVAIGRVMSFSYLTGKSISDQEYSRISAPTKAPDHNARGIGCHCTWFHLKGNNRSLLRTNMDVHGYYNINKYICTIPRPEFKEDTGTNLILSCNIGQILKYKK